MTNDNTEPKHEKKQMRERPKPKPQVKEISNLGDAYKFGVFCIRAVIAAATGKVFGDTSVDSALGTAIASIQDPVEIAEQGTVYSVMMNGAAGAWKAVDGDSEWE